MLSKRRCRKRGARRAGGGGRGGGGTHADPGVLEGFTCGDSLVRVDCEHVVDELLGLLCHRVPLW